MRNVIVRNECRKVREDGQARLKCRAAKVLGERYFERVIVVLYEIAQLQNLDLASRNGFQLPSFETPV